MPNYLAVFICTLMVAGQFGAASASAADNPQGAEVWVAAAPPARHSTWSIGSGLAINQQGFAASITAYQWPMTFAGFRQGIQYYRVGSEDGGEQDQIHGELLAGAEINPLRGYLFQPYVALLGSFQQWRLTSEGGSGFAAIAAVGLNIKLSRYFLLEIEHRRIEFLDDAPPTYWNNPVNSLNSHLTLVKLAFQYDARPENF